MQHAVALDISSPLHTSPNYNAGSLKSIPLLIFKHDKYKRASD